MPYFHMDDAGVWSRVSKPDGENGCWVWTGGRANRYGTCFRDGKSAYAHRLVWALSKGVPYPDGKSIFLHSCDNTLCVNPAHLSIGTRRQNAKDRDSKFRQARGERMGSAKMTTEKVLEARRRYELGEAQDVIAASYGVSRTCITHIIARNTWRHVP